MDPSRNRASPSSMERGAACSEESGWTMYFEDFLFSGENDRASSERSSGLYGSSSLVSDAASCAAWEVLNHQNEPLGLQESCKKLSFKKKRTRGARNDEDLEDTASSPANSPKVSILKQFDMNHRKGIHVSKTSQEEIGYAKPSELQMDGRSNLGFAQRGNEFTELKKKGLCLVPISMLANYIR
ncbi:vascular-related unknown protein 1-like [Aristolochia californica]|uniref:vascular-related unknown protein 1-like n=1 Tax=Aristolochia californica TaxID=171875 RepID=UPI0035DFC054